MSLTSRFFSIIMDSEFVHHPDTKPHEPHFVCHMHGSSPGDEKEQIQLTVDAGEAGSWVRQYRQHMTLPNSAVVTVEGQRLNFPRTIKNVTVGVCDWIFRDLP